jgi:hypothetical protein
LQARIDGLVAATLLSDDERDAIEDAMADAALAARQGAISSGRP